MQKDNNKNSNKVGSLTNSQLSGNLTLDNGYDKKKKIVIKEVNGPKGLEPTRYGDWESKGRCHDF